MSVTWFGGNCLICIAALNGVLPFKMCILWYTWIILLREGLRWCYLEIMG